MTPTDPTPLRQNHSSTCLFAKGQNADFDIEVCGLCATLDARELDVERLARAIHRWHNPSLSECSDPMGKHGQAAGRIAAEYARLSETNHE